MWGGPADLFLKLLSFIATSDKMSELWWVEIRLLPFTRFIAYTTACCYRTSRDAQTVLLLTYVFAPVFVLSLHLVVFFIIIFLLFLLFIEHSCIYSSVVVFFCAPCRLWPTWSTYGSLGTETAYGQT